MKRKLLAALIFFAGTCVFAKEKILHAETKYFDIIFEESSNKSASIIYEKADGILEDLCRQYRISPDFRIPVVISPSTEIFNGYFTNYNYNHIVLFDSVPDQEMLNFENTMESTFIHELTHLVSTNTRSPFWKNFDGIMGDIYNPGYYITMTTFAKEGATLYQESRTGAGRLNDGFYTHSLRQAKLSGKFPGYSDMFGSRSIYPSGKGSYLFGGAFTEYIIEKYGMDKYAEFWYCGINSKRITVPGVFKKTYGHSMKDEWKNFYDSIDIDGIDPDPLSTDGITESGFACNSLHRYSLGGLKGKELVVLDETTGTIYSGRKKIITDPDILSMKTSCGGKYICVTKSDRNHMEAKLKASIYNSENSRWTDLPQKGIKEAAVIEKNGIPYVVAISMHSQYCTLSCFTLDSPKEEIYRRKFSYGLVPYALSTGGSSIFFFMKDGLSTSLCRTDFDGGKISDLKCFPLDGLRVMDLFAESNADGTTTVLFSYCSGKSFPRLGMADISKDSMKTRLMTDDLSGGIYSPVASEGEVFYSAGLYDETKIFRLDENKFDYEKRQISSRTFEESNDATFEIPAERISEYRKFLYPGQTIVPLSTVKSYYLCPSIYHQEESDSLGLGHSYPFGLTVIKNNPSDTRHLAFTAGYNPLNNAGGFGFMLMGKTYDSFASLTDTSNVVFDSKGFMQASNNLSASLDFKTGSISHIVLSNSNFLMYGKDDMNQDTKDDHRLSQEQLDQNYFFLRNIASATFTTVHKTGPRTHETSGLALSANYKNVYGATGSDKWDSIYARITDFNDGSFAYSQLYPSAELHINRLLPLENKGRYTFNLPLILYGSLFPDNFSFAQYAAEAVLFSWEIQKGLGMAPIFANTVSLKANYSGELVNYFNRSMEIRYLKEDIDSMDLMVRNDYAGGRLVFTFCGNTGAIANPNFIMALSCNMFIGVSGPHKGEAKSSFTASINMGLF
ncbi:MAG: hypothetical protein KBS64_03930 [Treponema sp.]|nr:hypothetical protein [Candidatus Treponema equi]